MDSKIVASLLSRMDVNSAISILSILVDGLSDFAKEYSQEKSASSDAGNTATPAGGPIITSLFSAILHVMEAHAHVFNADTSANVPRVQM